MAATEDEWTEVQSGLDAELWTPTEGARNIGRYARTERVTVQDQFKKDQTRQAPIHYFQSVKDQTYWKMWGSVDLDGKISQLSEGDLVRITFVGTTEDNGKTTKRYKIEKSATGTVPGAETTADADIPF